MRHKKPTKNNRFNKVIFFLTASDVFTWAFMYSMLTFIGLYLAGKPEFSESQALRMVGVGAGIYGLIYGTLQVPVGIIIDKVKGNKDEVVALFFGNTLLGVPFLLYPHITEEYHYYILQMLLAIGGATNIVSWRKLFALNLDKDKEGIEYAGYEAFMAFAIALFSFIFGLVASRGDSIFDLLVSVIGVIMIASNMWVYLIHKNKNES